MISRPYVMSSGQRDVGQRSAEKVDAKNGGTSVMAMALLDQSDRTNGTPVSAVLSRISVILDPSCVKTQVPGTDAGCNTGSGGSGGPPKGRGARGDGPEGKKESRLAARASKLVERIRCPADGAKFLSRLSGEEAILASTVASLLRVKFNNMSVKSRYDAEFFSPTLDSYENAGGLGSSEELLHLVCCSGGRVRVVFVESAILAGFTSLSDIYSELRWGPPEEDYFFRPVDHPEHLGTGADVHQDRGCLCCLIHV